jgi:hypothetical protein
MTIIASCRDFPSEKPPGRASRLLCRGGYDRCAVAAVESLVEGNLFGHGELAPATGGCLPAETAAVVAAPLTVVAVGAGVFLARL